MGKEGGGGRTARCWNAVVLGDTAQHIMMHGKSSRMGVRMKPTKEPTTYVLLQSSTSACMHVYVAVPRGGAEVRCAEGCVCRLGGGCSYLRPRQSFAAVHGAHRVGVAWGPWSRQLP